MFLSPYIGWKVALCCHLKAAKENYFSRVMNRQCSCGFSVSFYKQTNKHSKFSVSFSAFVKVYLSSTIPNWLNSPQILLLLFLGFFYPVMGPPQHVSSLEEQVLQLFTCKLCNQHNLQFICIFEKESALATYMLVIL